MATKDGGDDDEDEDDNNDDNSDKTPDSANSDLMLALQQNGTTVDELVDSATQKKLQSAVMQEKMLICTLTNWSPQHHQEQSLLFHQWMNQTQARWKMASLLQLIVDHHQAAESQGAPRSSSPTIASNTRRTCMNLTATR